MKHKVRVTVLDKKLYPELQREYCADPAAGACPCYNIGDEFIFYRDDFWHMGLNTLVHTSGDADSVAGGPRMPFCSEAWDAIPAIFTRGFRADERLDEARKRNDRLLFRRHAPRRFQN